jgi:hypothetical protein
MTTTHDRTTSHELEREADANRAQLSETLDELRYMLTPGQITEELFSFARTSGASLLRSLGNAAVQNPIPTLLIGAGCAMFLSGSGRRAYRHEHWTGGQPSRGTVGGASESSFTTAARGATEALGRAAQSAGSAASATPRRRWRSVPLP